MLQIEDVTVRYGGADAVIAASLPVAAGEVVALLGPSGCGKSSLLRAVAGLEPLARGRVRWDGADLAGVPVHRRGFGLMFQEGQLFPHRDVAANVAFGLEMAREPRAQRARRVGELLDVVGLPGYGARAVTTLSGGEQQRVALARALAPEPRLLLLDEPLSALDRGLRERLSGELAQILRRTGTTALYVTHDHDEAFTVADRVVLMRSGRLVQQGTPAELWSAPRDAEAARFLGYQVVPDGAPAAGVGDAGDASGEERGRLALAPRALRVVRRGTGRVDGEVVSVSFARGEALVTVDVAGWGRVRAVVPATRDAARAGDEARADGAAPAGGATQPGGAAPAGGARAAPPTPGDVVGLALDESAAVRLHPS